MMVSYSYEYDRDIGMFLYVPRSRVGLHGLDWPRFVVTNGGTVSPVRVSYQEVNDAANEVAEFINRYYNLHKMDYKSYGDILSSVASRKFKILMKNLVKAC